MSIRRLQDFVRRLRDVDTSGLDDGEALLWNEATGKFEPGEIETSGSAAAAEAAANAYTDAEVATALASANAYTDSELQPIVEIKTSGFTAAPGGVYFVDATSGNIAITLPSVATSDRRAIKFKRIDSVVSNTVTVTGNANIDGESDLEITTQWLAYEIIPNGTIYGIM